MKVFFILCKKDVDNPITLCESLLVAADGDHTNMKLTILTNPPTWLAVILSLLFTAFGITCLFALVHVKNLIF